MDIYIIKIFTILLYILNLVKFNKLSTKVFNPIFILYLTIGYFYISQQLLDVFLYDSSLIGIWFFEGTNNFYINYLSSAIFCIFMLVTLWQPLDITFNINIKEDILLSNIAIIILLIASPFYIYYKYSISQFIQQNRYLDLYVENITFPFYVKLGVNLFKASFLVFLSSIPNKSRFSKITFLYISVLAIGLLAGGRGEFFTTILLIYSYIRIRELYKFKRLTVYIISLSLIFMALAAGLYREHGEFNKFYYDIFNDLYRQGKSFSVLTAYLTNFDKFSLSDNLASLLSPYINCSLGPIFGFEYCNNSVSTANIVGLWGHKLSYILNQELYLAGGGFGGNMLVSFLIMIPTKSILINLIFFPFIIILFFTYFIKYYKSALKNRFCFFLILNSLIGFYFLPRGVLSDLIPDIRFVTLFILIYSIKILFTKKDQFPR